MTEEKDRELLQLKRFIEAQQARGGLIVFGIAAFGALAGLAAVALVLVTLQQVREVTQISLTNRARIESLENSQAGIGSFIDESRARFVDEENWRLYLADTLDDIKVALKIPPKSRPKRTVPQAVVPGPLVVPQPAPDPKPEKTWWERLFE